tara:strand:+ start:10420 stop:10662 length:243 start_codon:yes stop_codon:yes gene_type:complete
MDKEEVIVGVVTPFKRYFDDWVIENGVDGEKYHWIRGIDSVIGMEFNRYEKAYHWDLIVTPEPWDSHFFNYLLSKLKRIK